MLRRVLVLCVSGVLALACLSGCGSDSTESESNEPPVKTEAQIKAEAEKEINEENMDEELAKIEKELEKDLNAEK